jgi:hypothetical protein
VAYQEKAHLSAALFRVHLAAMELRRPLRLALLPEDTPTHPDG